MGASAVVLLVSMFALSWYGLSGTLAPTAAKLGVSTDVNGWNGLSHLRWLMLVTIVSGLLLVYFQASRRAPALPVSLSVIVTVLGTLTALALVYRVVLNVPGPDSELTQKAGAFVGLVSGLALVYGGFESMRQEGIAPVDGPGEIETVQPGGAGGS